MKFNKLLFIDNFCLKIIGIITMTFDHIGIFLAMLGYESIASIFRSIGRLAFPLFAFMLYEGVKHSSNIIKYIKRLLTILLPMLLVQVIIIYGFKITSFDLQNPFITLIIIALFLYFLKLKDKRKYLSIIPLLYGIFSLVIDVFNYLNYDVSFFPNFLLMSYVPLSFLLVIGFLIADKISKNKTNYQIIFNIICSIVIILSNLIMLLCEVAFLDELFFMEIQIYSIFSFVFIVFYNGKLGYSSKGFRAFSYLYYPLHLVVLFAIFMLIII